LLALDLAAQEWHSAYADDVVAIHVPDASGPRPGRQAREFRNRLWAAWLRRPRRSAWRQTFNSLPVLIAEPHARRGFGEALTGLPWVLRRRRPIAQWLDDDLELLRTASKAEKVLQPQQQPAFPTPVVPATAQVDAVAASGS
jgi:hypothetical protein